MKLDRRAKGAARARKVRSRARDRKFSPTPIFVSRRTLYLVLLAGLVVLALVLYLAPTILVVAIGGTGLAIALSFPVRALSRFMPRGLAILTTFLALIGLIVLALVFLVPILLEQLRTLIVAMPDIAESADRSLRDQLQVLEDRNLLPGGASPDEFIAGLVEDLTNRVRALAENLLSSIVDLISRLFGFGVILFGVLFVAIYLLIDVRKVKAAYLRTIPVHYRRDARDLWDAFGVSLSRYLGGLIFVVAIEGLLVGVALFLLGVPYAPLLGVWVSITALIPYLGVFLGAIPAVIIALIFTSPTITIATIVVYVLIQQLEGNLLVPRIQGYAVQVHPIIVLLAVIGGGQLAGLPGVIFAVPTLAVLRVFFDFFRIRVHPTASNSREPGVEGRE